MDEIFIAYLRASDSTLFRGHVRHTHMAGLKVAWRIDSITFFDVVFG